MTIDTPLKAAAPRMQAGHKGLMFITVYMQPSIKITNSN